MCDRQMVIWGVASKEYGLAWEERNWRILEELGGTPSSAISRFGELLMCAGESERGVLAASNEGYYWRSRRVGILVTELALADTSFKECGKQH